MSNSVESVEKALEDNRENLDKLEEWISTQPHIPKNIPRAVLFRYFKVCRFDLEEARKLIDINVKFRMKHQYLFTDRDIDADEFRKVASTLQYAPFPKLTKEGYAIESFQIISPNMEDFILKDLFKLVIMAHDANALSGPNTNGLIAIYNATGFTFQHFMKLISSAQNAVHYSQYGQEATCLDIKQIHFVNCSRIISNVVSFFKPLLNKELKEKFNFHTSDFESLHKFIDKELLPIDFGGCEGTLKEYAENTLKNIHKYRDYLIKDENFFLHQSSD